MIDSEITSHRCNRILLGNRSLDGDALQLQNGERSCDVAQYVLAQLKVHTASISFGQIHICKCGSLQTPCDNETKYHTVPGLQLLLKQYKLTQSKTSNLVTQHCIYAYISIHHTRIIMLIVLTKRCKC